jgi:hypothetical protein
MIVVKEKKGEKGGGVRSWELDSYTRTGLPNRQIFHVYSTQKFQGLIE